MATEQPTRLCSLEGVVGKTEVCHGETCPFWEPGGAVLGGRCALDKLGLVPDAPVATWLLEIRQALGAAGSAEEERALRSAFHHLLNDSPE